MRGMPMGKSLMTVVLAALSGCGFITHDVSQAPGMNALVGQDFVTVQDGFLIKDSCIDEYKAKHCSQLQVVQGHYYVRDPAASGGGWRQLKLPVDQQALTTTPELAARLTWVPKGTTVTIVQLVSRSLGQYRRCWLVYGRVAGMPDDTVAEIPACSQWAPESEPVWFEAQKIPSKPYEPVVYDYSDRPPVPDTAFLTPVTPQ